jgi:branched-chain amino acid transport system substrate-binding protein
VFSEEFRRLGGEVVAFQGYTPETQDFTYPLRDIAGRSPGVLVLSNYRPDKFNQVRQARELGISAPILGSDAMAVSDPKEYTLLEGVYYTTHFARQAPGSKVAEFSRRYREAYGREPTLLGALTYDALMLLARALEHYDPDHPEQVHARMRTGTFEGVTGTVELGPGAPVKSCMVMQFRGGTDRFVMSYLP